MKVNVWAIGNITVNILRKTERKVVSAAMLIAFVADNFLRRQLSISAVMGKADIINTPILRIMIRMIETTLTCVTDCRHRPLIPVYRSL